jgi:predicted transcriptional regulator of viral defense system
MRTTVLNNSNKTILSIEDISNILSISKGSAKVTANRYVQNDQLIRLKRNYYITPTKFEKLNDEDLFKLANMLQVPSYISFMSALSYYNISTQQLQSVIESAALKRTKNINVENIEFRFILIKEELYSDFIMKKDFFIATPEKSLADAVYLTSLSRYSCDFEAIDFSKINKQKVNLIIEQTNKKTISFWKDLCRRYKI